MSHPNLSRLTTGYCRCRYGQTLKLISLGRVSKTDELPFHAPTRAIGLLPIRSHTSVAVRSYWRTRNPSP